MERITAASNLIIEVQPESWRLLVNGGTNGGADIGTASERVLVEAVPGEPLRYVSSFGSKRRLPASGSLDPAAIQRIVLGWSEKDASWHLGLVLSGDLVDTRGSRWCGLAYWHDPLANQLQDSAVHAGQTLAKQIDRPFTMIPPNVSEDAVMTTSPAAIKPDSYWETPVGMPGTPATPAARLEAPVPEALPEPIPQPALPLKFDLWTLRQETNNRLELVLSPAWGRSKLLRVAWNIVWLGVFIVLTVTTLTSGIALPRPELLVYLGIVSIIVLVLVIFYNLYQTATYINRITFDAAGVRWLRGKRVRRTIPVDALQEVYVSHVVSKIGKRGDKRSIFFGEITLLQRDGKFESVLVQQQTDEKILATVDPLDEDSVTPLTDYNARTRLQSAGLYIAQALVIPAEYDKRVK